MKRDCIFITREGYCTSKFKMCDELPASEKCERRTLQVGEKIKEGDLRFLMGCWTEVESDMIGDVVIDGIFNEIRRPLK